MKYASLETSAVNRASEQGIAPGSLRELLDPDAGTPTVGLHVIYEISRNFLQNELIDTGIRLSRYLYDLEPNVVKPVSISSFWRKFRDIS